MYKAGLYLRLSRDDGNDVSESIVNQRDFLIKYANDNNYTIQKIYTDDGYSGTTFERPAFKDMVEDINQKSINMVITKDLSRLGRDYILTGHYLERFFPEHNIRYIAVNDGVDTFSSGDDMNAFRAVVNDMYAKDISKKVRCALNTKKYKGKFIGAFAPYGYKKRSDDNNRLEIDIESAEVVERIFNMFLDGYSMNNIAKILTIENIPTPSQAKGYVNSSQKWNDIMIKRILTSETYIGNITQNRTRKINYKVSKKINLPQRDWIVVQNTHKAIISKEKFQRVQEIFNKKL